MSTRPKIVEDYERLCRDSTEEELKAYAYNSPAMHFGLCMEILDKNNRYIRPKPNVLQLRISEVIETIRDECPGLRARIIAVKPRRAGCSTFSLHCGYHEAQRRPIQGITIADCAKNSAMLTERLADFSGHDSFPWNNPLTVDNDGEKKWFNGSGWEIDTAENKDAGVGGTRQFGHFSEVAKFPQTAIKNDKKTMSACLPSLDGPETTGIAESTPENAHGWFHGTYHDAITLEELLKRWKQGFRPEEIWIRVFAAWWEFDDNARQETVSKVEREHIDNTLDDEEIEDREKFGLTYEQLAWRRDTIHSQCDGDPAIFRYYYPKDDVSCWISAGSARFDVAKLSEMKFRSEQITPDRGFLVKQDDKSKVLWQSMRDGTGNIEMWEQPKEGMAYLVACDPATGESQTVGEDPDATSILVLRSKYYDPDLQKTFKTKVVARVKAPFFKDDDIVGREVTRLSEIYGRCITVLEVNQGLHVLRVLKDAGVPLFKRVVESHKTKRMEEQYGFKLNDQNQRRMVIDGLAAALRNDEIEIPCPHILNQLMKFIRTKKGRYEAAPGEHDDDVMSLAMGWECIASATTFSRKVVRDVDPPDMVKPGKRTTGWRVVNANKTGW